MTEPTLQQKAEQAAQLARDAAELAQSEALNAELDAITCIKDFNKAGRTAQDAARIKSAYVTRFGYDKFVKLVANSR
jgi:hypothetical protein